VRRLVIAAVAAAVLVGAGSAAAKEVTQAKVCGVDGCTTTNDRTLLQALMTGGPPADPPEHPSGAIAIRAKVGEPGGGTAGRFTTWWVPQTQLVVGEDGLWMTLSPRATEVIASAAHGHKPFPPGSLGASFAGTSSHAAPPPPIHTTPVADDTGGGVDWVVIAVPVAIALLAAGAAVLLVRRRPGGATQ
jgi:hypothetical protein